LSSVGDFERLGDNAQTKNFRNLNGCSRLGKPLLAVDPDRFSASESAGLRVYRDIGTSVHVTDRRFSLPCVTRTRCECGEEGRDSARDRHFGLAACLRGSTTALLHHAPRAGRLPGVTRRSTLRERPAAATHWNTRRLATRLGPSATAIRRV